jgi:hypothetical protein
MPDGQTSRLDDTIQPPLVTEYEIWATLLDRTVNTITGASVITEQEPGQESARG